MGRGVVDKLHPNNKKVKGCVKGNEFFGPLKGKFESSRPEETNLI